MDPKLKRILALVRQTGDRLVIMDPESDEVFAVMNLDEYEALIGVQPVITTHPQEELPVIQKKDIIPDPEQATLIEEKPEISQELDKKLPESPVIKEGDDDIEEQFYLEPIE